MPSVTEPPGDAKAGNRYWRGFAVFVLFSALVCVTGILTDLRFSDEIFHFWFAREWFDSGHRPIYNDLVDTVEEFGYYRYYINAPLWHCGLAHLWKVVGRSSEGVAQLYQALIYLWMLINTYLLGRELYGGSTGWYAGVIVATIPFSVSFGILLFIDVPIAMLSPLCVLLILKKKRAWAGIVMGAMFLTKRNSYLLFPPLALLAFLHARASSSNKLAPWKGLLLFGLVALSVTVPDFVFRYEEFGGLALPNQSASDVLLRLATSGNSLLGPPAEDLRRGKHATELGLGEGEIYTNYLESKLTDPVSIVKYLGLCLPWLLALYMAGFRKRFHRNDGLLLAIIILYLVLYVLVFRRFLIVRYLSPVLPLTAVLAGKVLSTLQHRKWLRYLVWGFCGVQFLSALLFVYNQRQITFPEEEMLNYIESEVSSDARILTPEELFVSYYTRRPTVWVNSFQSDVSEFYYVLWGDDEYGVKSVLEEYGVRYVLIQEARVYDDATQRHSGGYPKSFVEKLPTLPFLDKVYENEALSIWKVLEARSSLGDRGRN
jgi:4-amino-4-deoxy-L-arabinose transferase-like glycosyltransferase